MVMPMTPNAGATLPSVDHQLFAGAGQALAAQEQHEADHQHGDPGDQADHVGHGVGHLVELGAVGEFDGGLELLADAGVVADARWR